MSATQITAVAGRADAVARLTGNGRAHGDLFDAHFVYFRGQHFVHHSAGLEQYLTGARIHHVFGHNPAQNTLRQGLNNVAAVNDRGHHETFVGPAILFGHDHVLSHINQTTR